MRQVIIQGWVVNRINKVCNNNDYNNNNDPSTLLIGETANQNKVKLNQSYDTSMLPCSNSFIFNLLYKHDKTRSNCEYVSQDVQYR